MLLCAHPALVKRLKDRRRRLWHVSNLYNITQQQELADKLVELTFADTVFFTNSGTESCELAVKMARKYWYDKGATERVDIIAFEGLFTAVLLQGLRRQVLKNLLKASRPLLPGSNSLVGAITTL